MVDQAASVHLLYRLRSTSESRFLLLKRSKTCCLQRFGCGCMHKLQNRRLRTTYQRRNQRKGVDVILDNMGGSYLQRNLNSLAVDGRLFIIGFMGGTVTQVNLQPMLARRLTIQVAGLRGRNLANKARIISEVEKNVWPAIMSAKVKPVIYKTLPLSEAVEAHKLMESSSHIGKILLIPVHDC